MSFCYKQWGIVQHLFRRFDMPRIAFFIIFLGLFWVGLGNSDVRADDSPYFVKAVQVDVLDESAVKARNKAFMEAQKKAFMMLAEKFETPESLAELKVPADNVLSGMIQDFEISNEQLSTKRYRGVFDFRFKPYVVNQYFGHPPLNGYGSKGDVVGKVLIVPYYQEGKSAPIFDKTKNLYLSSLRAELPKDEGIILPEGSISDTTDIGTAAPQNLSPAAIRRLKERYDVQTVFVAVASVDVTKPQSVQLDIFGTSGGQTHLVNTLTVSPQQAASSTFNAVKSPAPVKNDYVLNDEPQPLGPERIVQPVPASVPKEEIKPMISGEANIKVFFTSMSEWLSIQQKLRTANGGQSVRITSLKTNQVDAIVGYKDWTSFATALQGMGLSLQPQPNNTFILKRY